MKKKILSFLMALTAVTGCVGSYSASADTTTYYGHTEYIFFNGYIIKSSDINAKIELAEIGTSDFYSVKMTGGKDIGYDSFYKAYFNDEKFDEYEKSDEITGYYYVSEDADYEKLRENQNIEEIYNIYTINRNGLYMYENQYVSNELGGGHSKLIKADEIVKNDANGDGKVTAEDALKLLNVLVGNDTLTIKEKINLGINQCIQSDADSEYHNVDENYTLSTEKTLEILYQIVEE